MFKALSPNDQQAQLKTYTQVLICFSLSADTTTSQVVATLERGVQDLVKAIPYLGGEVYVDKDKLDPEAYGTTKLIYPCGDGNSILRVNDVRHKLPRYYQISKAKAPFDMLDGSLLTPVNGFPDSYDLSDRPKPVLMVQANFVAGGLLLCVAGLHNVMDGTGLGETIKLFAASCRGDKLPENLVAAANTERAQLIPPVLPSEKPRDLAHLRFSFSTRSDTKEPSVTPDALVWVYFRLSPSSLTELKAEASTECSAKSNVPWITTNDAVAALVWKSLTTARLPHLDGHAKSMITRMVNGRRKLSRPIPDGYIGNVVHGARSSIPPHALSADLSLSAIAIQLRHAILDIDDLYVRSQSQFFRSEPDKRKIGFSMEDPIRDLMLSSLTDLPISSSDFGPLLGRSDYVRRPNMTAADGLVYMMPRDAAGNLDLGLSLRRDDLERLKRDVLWLRYVEYIG